MSLRNFSSTAISTTLVGGITASGTSVVVAATTGLPAAPFILCLEPGTANQELILVTAVAGTTLTATRGYDSTTGVAHNTGAAVVHSHGAIDFREANSHVNATSNVHGVVTPVGATEAQTLTNKTIALGSNTVSGTLAQLNTAVTDADVASLAGTETLTNKTISADNNTLSGIAASSFVLSNASGNLDGAAAQKAIPAGVVVGTTDAQTLTNKTVALGSNTVSGTKAQFDTACTDADFASLAGTETLTNKTLTSPTVTTPVIGGSTLTQIQKGNATCVFSASAGPVTQAVTFAQAFSVAPEIVLGSQHATTIFWATGITTTGFTLNARQYDASPRSLSAVASWIAMV